MSSLRALNLAQHWLSEGADEDSRKKIRAINTGALSTTITDIKPVDEGRKRPPVPWWWGNDEDASHSSMSAMAALRKR